MSRSLRRRAIENWHRRALEAKAIRLTYHPLKGVSHALCSDDPLSRGSDGSRWDLSPGVAIFILFAAFTACAPNALSTPSAPLGWSPITTISDIAAPALRPAITVSGAATVVAWWNSSANGTAIGLTVARVLDGIVMQRVVLPLGHVPRALALYPGAGGLVQALWLDNGDLPGESRLYDAVIGPDLSLQRGPTLISSVDTIQYAAVALSSNTLAVMWTAYTGLAAGPLYLQTIDADGRPRTAIVIGRDARNPALAADGRGSLYVAWLVPQPDAIETIELAQYPADFAALTSIEASATPTPLISPIGVLAPDANQALDDFTLGIAANDGYLVWSEADINGQPNAGGVVRALIFPLDRPATGQQITVSDNGRWPVALNQPLADKDNALPISLSVNDGANWDQVVIWLVNDQLSRTDRFGMSGETIEQSALASNGDALIAAWATLADNGAARIYLSDWQPG